MRVSGRILGAVFSVKLVARPDARMVEVPLEIEAELPREFEGVALLAASGLPRKVRIKAVQATRSSSPPPTGPISCWATSSARRCGGPRRTWSGCRTR